MTGGTLLYKCRLCGVIARGQHVTDSTWAMAITVSRIVGGPKPYPDGIVAELTVPVDVITHACTSVLTGLADLAGVEHDPQPEAEPELKIA